jgi:hypothetical protein
MNELTSYAVQTRGIGWVGVVSEWGDYSQIGRLLREQRDIGCEPRGRIPRISLISWNVDHKDEIEFIHRDIDRDRI